MGWGARTEDPDLDARRNERLAWHYVLELMDELSETPLDRADHLRHRLESAKGSWWLTYLRLDQVRAQ